jgi:hypothetical protein
MKERLLNFLVISVLIIGTAIVLGTILVFLRHNHITFFGDIDEKTFGIFGDFIGGFVGTIFNIAVTYLVWITYKSQKQELIDTKALLTKQINISYKPDVYIKDTYVSTNISTFSNGDPLAINISNASDDTAKTYVHLSLVNIGVATAKDFTYQWDFNLKECVEFVEGRIPDAPIKFEIQNDGHWLMAYTNEDDANYFQVSGLFENHRFDILLPYKDNADEKALSLPLPYLVPYLIAFEDDYSKAIRGGKIELIYNQFPPLYLRITYKDLDNETHKKRFKMKLEFNSASTTRTGDTHKRTFELKVSGIEFF